LKALELNVDMIRYKSFLLALLGVFLAFSSRGFIGSFLLFCLLLGLESSLLFLHDFLVLLDSLGVHLDCGVAETAVVTIPVLSHEDSGSARGTGFALLGDIALA
jgi:hypothetical protein